MIAQKFCENVLKILRHDGVQVGQFEIENGMTKGYISRIALGSISTISLDRAYTISDAIGEDIYTILNSDWDSYFAEEDRKSEIVRIQNEIEQMEEKLKALKNVQ